MALKDWEAGIGRLIAKAPEAHRDVLRAYDLTMKADGLKESSRLRNLYTPVAFADYLGERELATVDRQAVRAFLADTNGGRAKRDLLRFVRWLSQEHGEGEDGPIAAAAAWVRPPRENAKKLPVESLLTEGEIRAMVEAAEGATAFRDRALVHVLYESALTHAEFLSLTVENAQFDRHGVRLFLPEGVREHGGRILRLIDSVPSLRDYLRTHPAPDDPAAPLWVSMDASLKRGTVKPLAESSLNVILKRLARRAGIKKRVHPHLFRHSRLTVLANRPGVKEHHVRAIAGWTATSRMVERYIHMAGDEIDRVLLRDAGRLPEDEGDGERPLAPKACPRCTHENEAAARFCSACSLPLTAEGFAQVERADEIIDALLVRVATDPDLARTFRDALERRE